MTTAFERIRDDWVPLWLNGFERKSRDYNTGVNENHKALGTKGQFADVWRKIGKLKKALWDDVPLEGEQPLEIIDDLISHLFLTRDLILQQETINREVHTRASAVLKNEPLEAPEAACGKDCKPRAHALVGECRYRLRGANDAR